MAQRTTNADVPYLAGLIGLTAGLSGAWCASLMWGVPQPEISVPAATAATAAFTTACLLGGIGFIEFESSYSEDSLNDSSRSASREMEANRP